MAIFQTVETAAPDPILGLSAAFKKDPTPGKINLGVGVFKDASGNTPILKCVKKAEARILESEVTKSYLDMQGSEEYGDYREEPPVWRIVEDVLAGTVTVVTREFGEQVLPDGDATLLSGEELRMTASDADPAHARMENEVEYRLQVGDVDVQIDASGSLTSTEDDFAMTVDLRVRLRGEEFFERSWSETIPRRLV